MDSVNLDAPTLVAAARAVGLVLNVTKGKLTVRGPKPAAALARLLTDHKGPVLAALASESTPALKVVPLDSDAVPGAVPAEVGAVERAANLEPDWPIHFGALYRVRVAQLKCQGHPAGEAGRLAMLEMDAANRDGLTVARITARGIVFSAPDALPIERFDRAAEPPFIVELIESSRVPATSAVVIAGCPGTSNRHCPLRVRNDDTNNRRLRQMRPHHRIWPNLAGRPNRAASRKLAMQPGFRPSYNGLERRARSGAGAVVDPRESWRLAEADAYAAIGDEGAVVDPRESWRLT